MGSFAANRRGSDARCCAQGKNEEHPAETAGRTKRLFKNSFARSTFSGMPSFFSVLFKFSRKMYLPLKLSNAKDSAGLSKSCE